MKKFLPFIIAIPLLLVFAMGGGFLAVQFFAPKPASAGEAMTKEAPAETGSKESAAKGPGPGPMLPFKERVVNLADPGGRYIKIAASIEFKPEKADFYKAAGEEQKKMTDEFVKSMSGKSAIIDDIFISTIAGKKSTELLTIEGKEKLKGELKEKLSASIKEPAIVNIYFTEFVMQ